MNMVRLAWRNVWRNKLRSLAVCGSVFLGLVAGVFASSLVKGMLEGRFKLFIENEISHLQVHHPLYLESRETEYTLRLDSLKMDSLLNADRVRAFTLRTQVQAIMGSPTYTAGVTIVGVDPQREDQTTQFSRFLIEGDDFATLASNHILVGASLLRKMKVGLGSRVVLSFQNKDHEIIRALFIVKGVFETPYNRYDNSTVWVERGHLNQLLGLSDEFHELAMVVEEEDEIESVAHALAGDFPEGLVRPWWVISPELTLWLDTSSIFSYLFILIILLGLAFGLLNTLLMVVHERKGELKMLMSLGMHKSRVFQLIVLESLFLAWVGTLGGWITAFILVQFYAHKGIDLSGLNDVMRELGFESVIYPSLDSTFFFLLPFFVLLFALLASLYPASRAIRLMES
jgi:putative ABC transport system permease protein